MMHMHINGAFLLASFLAAVIGFGILNIVAMKFRGHPAADAWSDIYGQGSA